MSVKKVFVASIHNSKNGKRKKKSHSHRSIRIYQLIYINYDFGANWHLVLPFMQTDEMKQLFLDAYNHIQKNVIDANLVRYNANVPPPISLTDGKAYKCLMSNVVHHACY